MPRILVVEDSDSMRSFVRTALEASPDYATTVEVVEASSGFDALRLLPRGPYDLVITDINMPDINGLELVTSKSSQGHVTMTLQFALEKSIDAAATDVQTAITQASGSLPR